MIGCDEQIPYNRKNVLKEAAYYLRMARGLPKIIRYPAHPDPEAVLREQMASREDRFLDTLQRVVLASPEHPYAQMFQEARCAFADVQDLVQRGGLECALETLRKAGVWLSHDEFKGKQPIVRNGRHIPATTASFDNPLADADWETHSSGSRSAGTRVRISMKFRAHLACYQQLSHANFDVRNRRWITMAPILPTPWGLTRPIYAHKLGTAPQQWYSAGGTLRESGHYQAVTRILIAEARLLGVPMPSLSLLPPNDFSPVAQDIARAREGGISSFVTGVVSSCVRVAAAALEKGLNISGSQFYTSSEALTDAKAEVFRRAGAEAFATYWVSELGIVGLGCPENGGSNSVHHFHDSTAIVEHRRPAPGTDTEVNSLLFTSLLPQAPFFVINLEIGDHGVMEPTQCNCAFSKLGYTTLVSDISSYSKLTGYGMTLVGTDILRILETALPRRFGGSPGDYQLVEHDAGSDTRIILRVDPRIGKISEPDIREYFLAEVRKLYGGSLSARVWRHAESVEVLAAPPIVGRTGKVLPLHLLGPPRTSTIAAGTSHAT